MLYYRSINNVIILQKKSLRSKEYHLRSRAVRYHEMKDIENIWLRHQAGFLPLKILNKDRLVLRPITSPEMP